LRVVYPARSDLYFLEGILENSKKGRVFWFLGLK
jgi:hypothetical protein